MALLLPHSLESITANSAPQTGKSGTVEQTRANQVRHGRKVNRRECNYSQSVQIGETGTRHVRVEHPEQVERNMNWVLHLFRVFRVFRFGFKMFRLHQARWRW